MNGEKEEEVIDLSDSDDEDQPTVVEEEQVTHSPRPVNNLHHGVVGLELDTRPAEVVESVPDHVEAVHEICEICGSFSIICLA